MASRNAMSAGLGRVFHGILAQQILVYTFMLPGPYGMLQSRHPFTLCEYFLNTASPSTHPSSRRLFRPKLFLDNSSLWVPGSLCLDQHHSVLGHILPWTTCLGSIPLPANGQIYLDPETDHLVREMRRSHSSPLSPKSGYTRVQKT